MSRWWIAFALLAVVVPTAQASVGEPEVCREVSCIQIGSFNIKYLGHPTGPRRSADDLKELAELIESDLDLEVVVLQEINTEGADWRTLRETLVQKGYSFFEGSSSSRSQFVVVAWDSDEVLLLESARELELPTMYSHPEKDDCQYSGLRRPVAVRLEAGNFDFWLVGLHLKSKTSVGGWGECDDWIRTQQVEDLVEAIDVLAEVDADVIVAGDLNDQFDSPPLAALRSAGFTTQMDFLMQGSGTRSYLGGSGEAIDHIALRYQETRELVPRSGFIFPPADVSRHRRILSDHVPVLASFRMGLAAPPVPLVATSPLVGDTIQLKASHHLGVPLHRQAHGSDDFERVADGTQVTVLEVREEGRWLRVRTPDDRSGWVIDKYIRTKMDGPAPTDENEQEVWSSRDACFEAVEAGARMARAEQDSLRLVTWNIRWFSQGCSSSEHCPENATDLSWLACTMTWLDADLVAVQEIMDKDDDRIALATVLQQLDGLTGGDWRADLQRCGRRGDQHVGFLWRDDRVELSNFADEEQLNGAFGTDPCAGNLRPGRYAQATSRRANGVDFQVVSVHLDQGTMNRDFQNRRAAIGEIQSLEIGNDRIADLDSDVLILGDFNTMGRPDEPPPITAGDELRLFADELAPEYRLVRTGLECSEYYRGEAGLLDHIVVATGMLEAASTARLSGYCAVAGCQPLAQYPAAYKRLSDHCPVVIDIRDVDHDD